MKLTKMQGCGNDFVIVSEDEYRGFDGNFDSQKMSEFAKRVCDRNFGVGADGLIITKTKNLSQSADIGWYFYNSDGTVAEMCGNGMRCFAKYVYDNKLVEKRVFSVDTLAGIKKPEILDNGQVRVNMGCPILEEEKIPFVGKSREIRVLDKTFEITPVSMGNPHCIIFTNGDPLEDAEKYGKYTEKHEYFPKKTNTEFIRVKSRNEIDLCVYERGCGITLACGTGASAGVVVCILNNLTEHSVKVNLPGGAVFVEWQGFKGDTEKDVFLTGPCEYSFFAEYML